MWVISQVFFTPSRLQAQLNTSRNGFAKTQRMTWMTWFLDMCSSSRQVSVHLRLVAVLAQFLIWIIRMSFSEQKER
ncbi:hypothetical protein DJ69_06405 [Halorubrum persicum]|uniref:Uncharacterized protein n=1 Tax=Halorubrum persicum TaxID=1383844 RepID=A0A2G1WKA9_9EURY|nr:hypothetical protein DJ69_06405 [Halorubrum persicum]